MSHLLHNPYNKPSPFDLPRAVHPLTPPDTDSEFLGAPFRSAPIHGTDALDADPIAPQASANETSTPFFRRQPSVSYINSGPRDFRERGPQRSMIKWLVVVIPPTSFSTEHGHLGHTLSSGSPNRLSQGILMPLFPTMGGQLGAIAREFSFPSTAGLCLYLHTNHNGISLYPRITDESWQLLWSHLFDVRGHGMQQPQLPISGQIEFDIDFSKARWYDSWVASPKKDYADVPQSVAGHSRLPSLSHWRGDSRTTFLDEQVDDQVDSVSVVQQQQLKAPRMVPRKLSLLDRFDPSSAVPTTKPPRHDSPQSPLSDAQYRVLSPIAQEEEPKTARKNVTNYVAEWRASAKISPSPLAATGQTSLDAANMPNILVDLPIAESEVAESELNLDDYAWSVSSLGPADYDIDDGDDSESWRLPSPDLARRQLSDAPPTPTTATSWGAPLSYPPSPVYGYSDYAPSVDLAGRAEFSRPVTPMTATSWGPPSYPQSPVHALSDYAPSVDLAGRAMYSRPVTPMTATSWGAPSYPTSPVSLRSGYAASVDLGGRAMSSRPATPSTATSWGPASWPASPIQYEPSYRAASPGLADRGMSSVPLTPATATSWGAPSYPVSPAFSEFRVTTPDLGARMFSAPTSPLPFRQRSSSVEESAAPSPITSYRLRGEKWEFVWPYVGGELVTMEPPEPQEKAHPSSLLVFPYYNVPERGPSPAPLQKKAPPPSRMVFPYYEPKDTMWNHVWPYQTQAKPHDAIEAKYPYFNLYPAVYPVFDLYPAAVSIVPTKADKEKSVVLEGSYAAFNLYPAVYPHFDVYPAKAQRNAEPQASGVIAMKPAIQVKLAAHYPCFDLYPAVYPASLEKIYPDVKMAFNSKDIFTKLNAVYPAFDIYPEVYPYNMDSIYPATQIEDVAPMSRQAAVVYPHFDIYPAVITSKVKAAVPTAGISATKTEVHVKLASRYPTFDLYPAVYPYSLRNVYPVHGVQEGKARTLSVDLPSVYPSLVVYPAVYPWNLVSVYPPSILPAADRPIPVQNETAISVKLNACYPHFDLYPAVYPYSLENIYSSAGPVVTSASKVEVSLHAAYPYFSLYPAVYPFNLEHIYPIVRSHRKQSAVQVKTNATAHDLDFVLCIYTCPYADVDPFLMLHPELADGYSTGAEDRRAVHVKASRYPVLDIYPAVYPFFNIYPEAAGESSHTQHQVRVMLCETRYPALEIYPAVYPFFHIYPEVVREASLNLKREVRVTVADTRYPTLDIYPAVYPHFKLYPAVSGATTTIVEHRSFSSGTTTRYPVFDIYPAVYPHFSIYPPLSSPVRRAAITSKQSTPVIRETPRYAVRHKPRFTHAQLCDQVFDEPCDCEEGDVWEMITPAAQPVPVQQLAAPPVLIPVAHMIPRYMPRRKPRYTHAQLHEQVFAQISSGEAADRASPLPQQLSQPVVRPRSRTGSLTNRPIPPPKPTDPSMLKPPPPPHRSSSLLHPAVNPRLSVAGAGPSMRPASLVGLPSHPAALRRTSSLANGPRPHSSASPTLATVAEPGLERSSQAVHRRIVPKNSLEAMRDSGRPTSRLNVDVRKSTYAPRSSVETLPPTLPEVQLGPELSRANTTPASKTGRSGRRMSIVMEKARAYDNTSPATKSTTEDNPARITMTALSQFPTPPRPPLPTSTPPKARPVSKLDRSKFPFI